MGKEISDEKLEQILREGICRLYDEVDEEHIGDVEPVPIPPELRERVLAKATQASGMLAAAEARAQGVEISGWEASPGADAEHYFMTKRELTDLIRS